MEVFLPTFVGDLPTGSDTLRHDLGETHLYDFFNTLAYVFVLGILCVFFDLLHHPEVNDQELARQNEVMHISLHRLSGATHELSVPRNIDIRTLKEKIESALPYPVGCQQLVHETSLLEDHMLLSNLCKTSEKKLELSIMLSGEFLKDMLRMSQSHCEYFRLRAIGVFRTLGCQAGDIGVRAFLNCLQDNCRPRVRRRALDALLQMAKAGEQKAISSLVVALQLVPEDDSKLLAQVWLQLLKGNNRAAVVALCKLLKCACLYRRSTVCTMLREARMDTGPAILEAARLLKLWSVGTAEPEATCYLLSMGNEHAKAEWKQLRQKCCKPKRDRRLMRVMRSRISLSGLSQSPQGEIMNCPTVVSPPTMKRLSQRKTS